MSIFFDDSSETAPPELVILFWKNYKSYNFIPLEPYIFIPPAYLPVFY